jgi:hypothetical protein
MNCCRETMKMGVSRAAQALAPRAWQPQDELVLPVPSVVAGSLSKEHPRTPGRTAILFALAALRSVPHRWRHLRQAGSQFRGRSKSFVKYPGSFYRLFVSWRCSCLISPFNCCSCFSIASLRLGLSAYRKASMK